MEAKAARADAYAKLPTILAAQSFFDHPMISSLFRSQLTYEVKERDGTPHNKELPAYIPPKNFARAALACVGELEKDLPPSSPQFLLDIQAIYQSKKSKFKDDIEAAEAEVEAWYDSVMERMTAVYKKNAQFWLFGIGFVAAAFLNFDTPARRRSSLRKPEMRTAIVAEAEAAAEQGDSQAYYESLGCRIGAPNSDQITDVAETTDESATPDNPGTPIETTRAQGVPYATGKAEFDCLQDRLGNYGLPIGWDLEGSGYFWDQIGERPTMLFGWLLTAFAMCFGATFWFDMLNKVINVRSTLRPNRPNRQNPTTNRQLFWGSRSDTPGRCLSRLDQKIFDAP